MENQIISSSRPGSAWGRSYWIHVWYEGAGSWGNLGESPGDPMKPLCPLEGDVSCHRGGGSGTRRVSVWQSETHPTTALRPLLDHIAVALLRAQKGFYGEHQNSSSRMKYHMV